MALQNFGNPSTIQKLEVIEEYFELFNTVLKFQSFERIYVDAFAGSGEIQLGEETGGDHLFDGIEDLSTVVDGSARRALRIKTPFHQYHFVEAKRANIARLRALKTEYPILDRRIWIHNQDANSWLKSFCARMDWRGTRAVVFLDPYGNQVEWSTLEALARTKAVDLWYLFPSGLGVNRQIANDKEILPDHAASLDRIFGPNDWRKEFYGVECTSDLFGPLVKSVKQTDVDRITRFMVQCLKKEFKGGVLDTWLPLGRQRAHWYSLIFAWANPDPKAALAGTLAKAVMTRK